MTAETGRREVGRWEVLHWNPDWTDRDRRMIAAAIDAIASKIGGEPTMYLPPSETYIGVLVYGDLGGHYGEYPGYYIQEGYYRALTIYKGKMEWVGNGTIFTSDLDDELFSDMDEGTGASWDLAVFMQWHRFSTYGGRRTHRGRRNDLERVCPKCNLAVPSSAVCDDCGSS